MHSRILLSKSFIPIVPLVYSLITHRYAESIITEQLRLLKVLGCAKRSHLVNFDKDDNFICRVAKTIEDAKNLIETGFEYTCEIEDAKLFRKRK